MGLFCFQKTQKELTIIQLITKQFSLFCFKKGENMLKIIQLINKQKESISQWIAKLL